VKYPNQRTYDKSEQIYLIAVTWLLFNQIRLSTLPIYPLQPEVARVVACYKGLSR